MRKDDEKYLEKAAVLVEALPYIQKFNRKVIVVKYGGSAMVDENLKKSVISDVTLLAARRLVSGSEKSEKSRSSSTDFALPMKKPWRLPRWCWAV